MTTIDTRLRIVAPAEEVDPVTFFEKDVPELLERNGTLAVPAARQLGVTAFGFEVGDRAWTITLDDHGLSVGDGLDDAGAVLRLSPHNLSGLVHDTKAPMAFLLAGELDMPRGDLSDLFNWWVVLRALIDGRPAYTRGSISFQDRHGHPLDLTRSFRWGVDDDADIAHFLAEAGYVHLRAVFTEDEMAVVSDEIDAATPRYSPDDGRSWWATVAGGEQRAVRLQHFQQESPTTRRLLEDERFLRIGALFDDGHQAEYTPGTTTNAIEALIKPLNVVEGISDVSWHKDCSLGRHSYRCNGMVAGICVTGADEKSGQLRVVAGSHRALIQAAMLRDDLDLPQVGLITDTGDITIHLTCTLHMSEPPVERERRVMYSGFRLPGDVSETEDDELSEVRENATKHVSQAAGGGVRLLDRSAD